MIFVLVLLEQQAMWDKRLSKEGHDRPFSKRFILHYKQVIKLLPLLHYQQVKWESLAIWVEMVVPVKFIIK